MKEKWDLNWILLKNLKTCFLEYIFKKEKGNDSLQKERIYF